MKYMHFDTYVPYGHCTVSFLKMIIMHKSLSLIIKIG